MQILIDATIYCAAAGPGSFRVYVGGQDKAGQSRLQRGHRLLLAAHALEEGGECCIHIFSFFF